MPAIDVLLPALDENTFRWLELAGVWLASIATVAAVITSLWLARRGDKIRLAVSVSHSLVISAGSSDLPEYIVIKVTNLGRRTATLQGVGWRSGLFPKGPFSSVQAYQKTDGHPANPVLPRELGDGQYATFLIAAERDGERWYDDFVAKLVPTWVHRRTLKALAWTSTGEVFAARPSRSFLEELLPGEGSPS